MWKIAKELIGFAVIAMFALFAFIALKMLLWGMA